MRNFVLSIVAFAFLLLPSISLAGTVHTVDKSGFGDYTSINSAINGSTSGDEVHVAAGTYRENVVMMPGVNLLGGYSASGWSRDISANATVIDAGGSGSAVTAATATLDGFTIRGGGSTGLTAGVYVYACSPVISNNVITANGRYGIYVEGNASPAIRNNVISANGLYGIYCYSFGNGGVPEIYNNVMDGNSRGINLYSFSPRIKNNIISSSSEYGISSEISSNPDSDYNDFWADAQGAYYGLVAGAHDKAADPLYVGTGDFHLSTTPVLSPCIDAGVDVGLPYINLPDMGAYESAATQQAPWPPEGLKATPMSTRVGLDWTANKEPNIAGYKLSYGNAPGSYTNTVDVGNVTRYTVTNLVNEAAYFFALRAYNTLSNDSAYSSEATATPTGGTHELPHYNWDPSYNGGDCTMCHLQDTGSGELLPQGFDYRYSSELCVSCHNATGQASGKKVDLASSHPVFVAATTLGDNLPTYGNITGRWSNRMGDHMKDGRLVVCNTCHNSMEKTEDPGRTWELTASTPELPGQTFALQKGGWSWYDFVKPVVYTYETLIQAPSNVKNRAQYACPDTSYDYDIGAGKITFGSPQTGYAYVTLGYPYLRVSNTDNTMCLDCHNMGTHQLTNCMTCHDSHNYKNRHGIKARIKTPGSGTKDVVFKNVTGPNSFADGDNVYDGICEVCHTKTKYYRNDGTGFANHSGGYNYDRKDCTACHTHVSGFSKY